MQKYDLHNFLNIQDIFVTRPKVSCVKCTSLLKYFKLQFLISTAFITDVAYIGNGCDLVRVLAVGFGCCFYIAATHANTSFKAWHFVFIINTSLYSHVVHNYINFMNCYGITNLSLWKFIFTENQTFFKNFIVQKFGAIWYITNFLHPNN